MAVEPRATSTGDAEQVEKSRPLLSAVGTKVFHLLIVLVVAAIGYWVAPADLAPGEYTATVGVTVEGRTLLAELPFTLGQEAGEPVTITEQTGRYRLVLEGMSAYPYKLNQQIRYQVRLLDTQGNEIALAREDVSSRLTGPNGYAQSLPPTQRVGNALAFTVRVPFKAKVTLGLLLAVAALWLLETVPLAAAALLIPVVIVVTRVTDAQTVLQPFFHPIIVLFLAGFLMAEGMRRTGFDRLVALAVVQRSSTRPAILMLTMMGITAFLSMWMSNTAAVAIILPIALAILEKIPNSGKGHRAFSRAMVLGVAYCGTIGGIGSAIGTPANMLAMTFLSEFTGTELVFVDWFKYGLPVVLVMVPLIWLYLLLTFGVRKLDVDLGEAIRSEAGTRLTLTRAQKIIGVIFVIVVLLWLTETLHGIDAEIVALAGALALFFFGTIKAEDLNRINWNALITFGGGMAIGTILMMTGVSDWLALQLIGLGGLPAMLVVLLVAALTVATGALISNTACAAMLIPLAIPLAQILQIDPRLLVAVVAIASSIDFALVIGTPPTMLAYSTGFFQTSEIFKRGIVLDVIGVIVLSLGTIWVWQLLGAVTIY